MNHGDSDHLTPQQSISNTSGHNHRRIKQNGEFFDKITSAHVVLDSEHVDKTVEITMNTQGRQVVAFAKADSIGKAIDEALAKTERQLKKLNQKIKSHKPA